MPKDIALFLCLEALHFKLRRFYCFFFSKSQMETMDSFVPSILSSVLFEYIN